MRKRKIGNRVLATVLSVLMMFSNTAPAIADVVGSNDVIQKAVLKDGQAVNAELKALAGNTVPEGADTGTVLDSSVQKILSTSAEPGLDKEPVDISAGSVPVYAWFEPVTQLPTTGESFAELVEEPAPADNNEIEEISNDEADIEVLNDEAGSDGSLFVESVSKPEEYGVIYLYSPADVIAYGEDASGMFEGFVSLTDISGITAFDFSEVKNADKLFQNDRQLEDITAVRAYRGDALESAKDVFSGTLVKEEDLPYWYKEANTVTSEESGIDIDQSKDEQDIELDANENKSEDMTDSTVSGVEAIEEENVSSEGIVSGDHTNNEEIKEEMEEEETSSDVVAEDDSHGIISGDQTGKVGIVSGDQTGKIGIVSGDHSVKTEESGTLSNTESIVEEAESEPVAAEEQPIADSQAEMTESVAETINSEDESASEETESVVEGVDYVNMTLEELEAKNGVESEAEEVMSEAESAEEVLSDAELPEEEPVDYSAIDVSHLPDPVAEVNLELPEIKDLPVPEETEEVNKDEYDADKQDEASRRSNAEMEALLKNTPYDIVELIWNPDVDVDSAVFLTNIVESWRAEESEREAEIKENIIFPTTAKPTNIAKEGYSYIQYYGGTLTRAYTLVDSNGTHVAICLCPPLNSPSDGTYGSSKIYEITQKRLLKVLYYGYGGPAQLSGVSLATTHMAAAKVYGLSDWSYSASSNDIARCNAYLEAINKLPDPPYGTTGYILNAGNGTQHLAYIMLPSYGMATIDKDPNYPHITDIDGYSLKALFSIIDSNGTEVYSNVWTDPNTGVAKAVELPPGRYTAVETMKPYGVESAASVQFNVVEGRNTVLKVTNNYRVYGNVALEKKDAKTKGNISEAALSVARFHIEEENTNGTWTRVGGNMTYDSARKVFRSSGKLYKKETNTGRFKIVEDVPPTGYKTANDVIFTLGGANWSYDNKVLKEYVERVVMTDQQQERNIYLQKKNSVNNSTIQTEGTFKLYQWSKKQEKYVLMSKNGDGGTANPGKMIFNTSNHNYHYNDVVITPDNGGKFMIKEESSPEGFTGNYVEKFTIKSSDPTSLTFTAKNTPKPQYGKINLLKKSTTGETIGEGAVFKVYEYNSSTNSYTKAVDTMKYNSSTGKYSTNPNKLEITTSNQGKFRVEEAKMPPGYYKQSGTKITRDVTLTSGGNYTVDITMTNTPNEYVIHKVGPEGEVVNAKFKITVTNADSMPVKLVANGTNRTIPAAGYELTTSGGTLTLQKIPKGNYSIVETAVLSNGYVTNPMTFKFFVNGNGEVTDNKGDDHVQSGSVTIVDELEEQGTKLTITKAANPSTVVENGFPAGTEFKVEARKGSGYVAYDSARYDTTAHEFVSKSTGQKINLVHTAENGGQFRVTETKATPGYIRDTTPKTVTIQPSDEEVTVSFTNSPNSYDIQKTGVNASDTMNARFEVTYTGTSSATASVKVNGTVRNLSSTATNIDTSNGLITFTALPAGVYSYKEIASLESNAENVVIDPKTYTFTVNGDGTISDQDEKKVQSATNRVINKYGVPFELTKVSSDANVIKNGFPNGTEFELQEWNETGEEWVKADTLTYDTTNSQFVSKKTGARPVLTYTASNLGNYQIVETKVTPGYIKDTTPALIEQIPETLTTSLTRTVTFTNVPNHFELLKVDIDGNPLQDAAFHIQNTNNVSENYTLYTDEMGLITLDALTPGEWTYQETVAPHGCKLDSTVYSFTVLEDGNILDEEGNPVDSVSLSKANGETAKIRIRKFDTQTGHESDAETGFPKGTTFAVYEWNEAEQKFGTIPIRYITYGTDEEIANDNVTVSADTIEYAGGNITFPTTGNPNKKIVFPKTDVTGPITQRHAIIQNGNTTTIYVKLHNDVTIDNNHKHLWLCYEFITPTWVENNDILDTGNGIHCTYAQDNYSYPSTPAADTRTYDARFQINTSGHASDAIIYWVMAGNVTTKPTGEAANHIVNYGDTCVAIQAGFGVYHVTVNNGNSASPTSQTKDLHIGKRYSSDGLQNPTRTGYTFSNWKRTGGPNDNKNMGTASTYGTTAGFYTNDASGGNKTRHPRSNQTQTWTAVWTPNTYTVKYNANGGSGSMADTSHTYDVAKALRTNNNNITRTGYQFKGWAKTKARADAGTVDYTNGQSVTNLTATNNGTVTLYAVWKGNTYYVKYNANLSGVGGTMANSTHTYGTSKKLSTNAYTKTGYKFLGWATSKARADAGTVDYTNAQSVTNLTSTNGATVNLYGVWRPIKYNIKYNANGGSGTMANTNNVSYDNNVTLRTNTFTNGSLQFAGWATSPNGNVVYTNGQTVKNLSTTDGATVNLYAIWKTNVIPKDITLRYWVYVNAGEGNNLNDGTGNRFRLDSTSDKSVYLGTPSEETYINHRAGDIPYVQNATVGDTFVVDRSWAMENPNGFSLVPTIYVNGTGNINIDDGTTSTVNNTGTFYVTFNYRADTYNITYNLQADETNSASNPATYTALNGTPLYPATKPGFTFLGWRDQYGNIYENGSYGINQGPETYYQNNFANGEDLYDRMSHRMVGDLVLTPLWSPQGNFVDPDTCELAEIESNENNKGRFLIREVEATEGYILDPQELEFTIDDVDTNGIIDLSFNNEPNGIKIRKVDENGIPLRGATFRITSPTGESKDYTTVNVDGYITLSRLHSGTWTYQEIAAPSGVVVDNTVYSFEVAERTHTLSSGEETIVAVNVSSNSYAIRKLDANGKAVSGIVFEVTSPSNETTNYTTNENGYILLTNLSNGTYSFKESATQPNITAGTLILDTATYTFTVSNGEVNGTNQKAVVNDVNKFTLTKTDENGNNLNGAEFHIWNDNAAGTDAAYDRTLTTGTADAGGISGVIEVKQLAAGTWHWQETSAPDGHAASDSSVHDFTVSNDGKINGQSHYEVTATNERIPLTLVKKGENGATLANVKFRIWNNLPSDNPAHLDNIFTTNASGEINISSIVAGTYYYQETEVPAGYVRDKSIHTLVVNSEVTPPVEIELTNEPNEFELVKIDKLTGQPITTGTTKFRFTYTPLVAGTTSSVTNNTVYQTDANGKISFTKLAPGTYTFVETEAPGKYILDETVHTFTVDADGGFHSDDDAFTISNTANTSSAEIAIENTLPKEINVTVTKKDDAGNVLTGCTFEVFKVTIPAGGTLDEATLTPYSPQAILTYDATTQKYKYEGIPVVNDTDIFCVKETAAPNGYARDFKEFFTASETSDTQPIAELAYDAVNTKNGITITKLDEYGNVITSALSFLVWKGSGTKTSYAATNGVVTLEGLSAGTWHYSEDPDHVPAGFLPDEDALGNMNVYDFTVGDDGFIVLGNGEKTDHASFSVVDGRDLKLPIQVRKIDEEGNVLQNVVFKAYPYSASADGYLEDAAHAINMPYNAADQVYKSEVDLKITPDNEGMFLIKEISAPEGYVADWSEEVMIGEEAVIAGNPLQVVAENRKNRVYITKVDENGATIEGEVSFLVWKGSGAKTSHAAVNGVAMLEGLSAGTWHYSEDPDHVPDGYMPDIDANGNMNVYDFTVNDKGQIVLDGGEVTDEASFTVTDKPFMTIRAAIDKKNELGEVMENVEFEAYPYSKAANSGNGGYLEDDAHAIHFMYDDDTESPTFGKYVNVEQMDVTLDNMGKYLIKEVSTGEDGYAPDWQAELNPSFGTIEDDQLFSFTAVNYPNEIRITKKGGDGTLLENVKFSLEEILGNDYAFDEPYYSEEATTNASGVATFSKIPEGHYVLAETQGVEGYKMSDEEIHITVDAEGRIYRDGQAVSADRVLELEVINPKNRLVVLKLDSPSKTPISGVAFRLDKIQSDDLKPVPGGSVTPVGNETTGADGKVAFEGLSDGLYYLTETSVPAPYTITFEPRLIYVSRGGLRINYSDEPEAEITYTIWNGQPPSGNVKIRKVDADTNQPLTGAVFEVWPKDTTVQDFNTDTEPSIMTLVYRDGYYVNPEPLVGTQENQGIFIIKETKAPDGYYGVESVVVNIFEDNNFEATVANKKTKLIIEKYDTSESSEIEPFEYLLLDGAKFKFWEDGHESDAVEYTTGAVEPGKIIIENLSSGKTYHFQETVPPEGFALNDEIFDVEVSNDGRINLNNGDCVMSVPNTPTQTIPPLPAGIHLRAGGEGRTMLYIVGGCMAVVLTAFMIIRKKKKKDEEKSEDDKSKDTES